MNTHIVFEADFVVTGHRCCFSVSTQFSSVCVRLRLNKRQLHELLWDKQRLQSIWKKTLIDPLQEAKSVVGPLVIGWDIGCLMRLSTLWLRPPDDYQRWSYTHSHNPAGLFFFLSPLHLFHRRLLRIQITTHRFHIGWNKTCAHSLLSFFFCLQCTRRFLLSDFWIPLLTIVQ